MLTSWRRAKASEGWKGQCRFDVRREWPSCLLFRRSSHISQNAIRISTRASSAVATVDLLAPAARLACCSASPACTTGSRVALPLKCFHPLPTSRQLRTITSFLSSTSSPRPPEKGTFRLDALRDKRSMMRSNVRSLQCVDFFDRRIGMFCRRHRKNKA